MPDQFITINLKGQAQANAILRGLSSQFKPIAMRPTLDWLESELTKAFKEVIGLTKDTGALWRGLSNVVDDDKLTYYEGAAHGPFVRRGTRAYHGGSGRAGGYQRLKTWAESKLKVDESAASRIAWFTLQKGTRSIKSATYPPGRPQYDYPLKVVEVDGAPALQRVADKLGQIVISYVNSKQAGLG